MMDIVEILYRYSAGDEFQRPVEAAIEEIEQLRQRVAELEEVHRQTVDKGVAGFETLIKRVQELEKERDELAVEARRKQRSWMSMCKERDEWEANSSQWEQEYYKVCKERDKAHQYWQTAEGRCDALKQQRDELLAALEELSLYVAHNGDDWVQKKAKAAIASVKEK